MAALTIELVCPLAAGVELTEADWLLAGFIRSPVNPPVERKCNLPMALPEIVDRPPGQDSGAIRDRHLFPLLERASGLGGALRGGSGRIDSGGGASGGLPIGGPKVTAGEGDVAIQIGGVGLIVGRPRQSLVLATAGLTAPRQDPRFHIATTYRPSVTAK